jgi:hypothetical protein
MLTGALIVESLRVGAVLDSPDLTVRRLTRAAPPHVTSDQPPVWTLLEFTSGSADPDLLAQKLSAVLNSPGWYANFDSDGEVYVVFPGRVFRYARDDDEQHELALIHARSAGIPEEQCDWR